MIVLFTDLERKRIPIQPHASSNIVQKQLLNDLSTKVDSTNYKIKTNNDSKNSSVNLRQSYVSRAQIQNVEKLSSPALVVQNRIKREAKTDLIKPEETVVTSDNSKCSEKSSKKFSNKPVTRNASSPGKDVLRQPKKSEMAYFGVTTSPKINKKLLSSRELQDDKPDLLQFNTKSSEVQEPQANNPIYENIDDVRKNSQPLVNCRREFDSSILEELTKAADQILQAVNGYTDEDSQTKFSTDDEDRKKTNYKLEPLDTISETKSWKRERTAHSKCLPQNRQTNNAKTKLKHTSSTSSVESVARESRKTVASVRKLTTSSSSIEQKAKKKVSNGDGVSSKANVRARRLQRANSREALLHSHGSSSEDLPMDVPVRKPRLIRKTRTSQMSLTSGVEISKRPVAAVPMKKREDPLKGKLDERYVTIFYCIREFLRCLLSLIVLEFL